MAARDVATATATVFLDLEMSLGTRTRLAVSFPASSTTVADLKRKVSHEHAATFPDFGQISVESIKVEQGGSWYHLSDSMAVRDAFHRTNNKAWHLKVDAVRKPKEKITLQEVTRGRLGGHSGF